MGTTDSVLGQKEASWIPPTFVFYEHSQGGIMVT